MKKKLVASTVLASTIFTSIPVQATEITTRQEFETFYENSLQKVNQLKNETESQLSNQENKNSLIESYDATIQALNAEKAGADNVREETFAVDIQPFITKISQSVSKFEVNCNHLIQQENQENEELNALKAECNIQLKTIESLCTDNLLLNSFLVIKPDWEQRIQNSTTVDECSEVFNLLVNLSVEYMCKNGTLQSITYVRENYSTENQEILDALVQKYKQSIIDVTGDLEFISEKVNELSSSFNDEKKTVKTLTQELEELKTEKINSLNQYQINESQYSEENVRKIRNYISSAITEIQSANSKTDIEKIYNDCFVKIDNVLTLEEEAALLEAYKVEKITEIKNYLNNNDYFAEEVRNISEILKSGEDKINKCTDYASIDSVVQNTKLELDEIKTKIEIKEEFKNQISNSSAAKLDETKEKITTAYNKAIQNMETATTKEDLAKLVQTYESLKTTLLSEERTYISDKKDEINNINISDLTIYISEASAVKEKALSDIEKATNKNNIESIISDCKSKIELIRTNEENYHLLQQEKTKAIEELTSLKNTVVSKFLKQFKEEAETLISNKTEEINSAISISDVQQLLENTKTEINKIKKLNDEEVNRLEQLETDKENAISAIQTMKGTANNFLEKYKVSAMNLLNQSETQISQCTTSNQVKTLLNETRVAFEEILNQNATEVEHQKQLELAKQNAITEIEDVDISSLTNDKLEMAENLIQESIRNINASTSIEKVTEIKNKTISELNRILDEQKTEEEIAKELEKAKELAIQKLNELNYSHLTVEHQEIISSLIQSSITEINSVSQKSEIQPILDKVTNKITEFETEERELETKKNLATYQLNQISTEGMLEKYRTQLEERRTLAISNISEAKTISKVTEILSQALTDINKIKADDLAERQEIEEQQKLEELKQTKISQLQNISVDGLLDKNKERIEEIKRNAIQEIEDATSISQVNELYSNATEQIQAIKIEDQREQQATQDLKIAKQNAKKTLTDVSVEDLLEKNREKILSIKTEKSQLIDAAEDVQAVYSILNDAMNQINNIKEEDRKEQEAINALINAKVTAKNQLQDISVEGLLEKNQEKIQKIVTETLPKIEDATTVQNVETILNQALLKIEQIKEEDSSEQAQINELKNVKKQAIQSLQKISLDDLYEKNKKSAEQIIEQAIVQINSATTKSQVTNLFSKALKEINEIKNIDKAEKALVAAKENAISEISELFIVLPYFTEEDKNTLNTLKSETLKNINEATTVEKVTLEKNNGTSKYQELKETSFLTYKETVKTSFEQSFSETIKKVDTTGETKLNEFIEKVNHSKTYDEIETLKNNFKNWLNNYGEEKIIESANYTGKVSPIDPTIDVTKFEVHVVNRKGIEIKVESSMISVNDTKFNTDGSCTISFNIKDVGNYTVIIPVEAVLEELKLDCIEKINKKYHENLKYTDEIMENWLENTIASIQKAENQESVLNIFNKVDDTINKFKSFIYKETMGINQVIDINTETIDEKNVICFVELYSGEIIYPTKTVSNIIWENNQAFVFLDMEIDGAARRVKIELKHTIELQEELEKIKNQILSKEIEFNYTDIQKLVTDEINHNLELLDKITTIEEYKNQVSEIVNDVDELINYYKNINDLRLNMIEKINKLEYNFLNQEHQKVVKNMIDNTIAKLTTMFDSDKMEEEYQSIVKMIKYYQTVEDEARTLQEVKDNKIEEIKKIDTSIYKEEDKAKDLITETIVSITNAKTKEEVNELFDKLKFNLDALDKKSKEEDKNNQTSSTTNQSNNNTTDKTTNKSEGKTDGISEPVKTGENAPIIMLSILGFAGIGCYLYKKKDNE